MGALADISAVPPDIARWNTGPPRQVRRSYLDKRPLSPDLEDAEFGFGPAWVRDASVPFMSDTSTALGADPPSARTIGLRGRASPAPRRHLGWRTPVATVLIVVGCLLAPLSVLAVWSANQVSDTGRYVANVEPLIHDPAIQNALTDKITNEVTGYVHVTAYADQAARC